MSKPEDIPYDVMLLAHAAWNAAGQVLVFDNVNILVTARAIMAAEKRGEDREREGCADTARRDLEVNAQVAARANLVGYAAEFYNAAKFSVPAAIRKRGEGRTNG